VRAVLLGRDLIIGSRIAEAAARAGVDVRRVDDPAALPAATDVDLLLVDWGDRGSDWGQRIRAWRDRADRSALRVIVFGPHTDLEAHAEARAAGIGPMMARSKLVASLGVLLKDHGA
jgi:DNA-binding response OmpR family regulator